MACSPSALTSVDGSVYTQSFVRPSRAPLAQLDRASGYEPGGRRFESCKAHHLACASCFPYSLQPRRGSLRAPRAGSSPARRTTFLRKNHSCGDQSIAEHGVPKWTVLSEVGPPYTTYNAETAEHAEHVSRRFLRVQRVQR